MDSIAMMVSRRRMAGEAGVSIKELQVVRRRKKRRSPFVLRVGSSCITVFALHTVLLSFLLLFLPSLDLRVASDDKDKDVLIRRFHDSKTVAKETPVVIAYCISITSCGGKDEGVADGAAVLAYSIRRQKSQGSKYDSKLYAFVHPDAEKCSHSLDDLGYEVQIRETPINATEIKGEFLRRTIQVRGCCQEKELLKLYAYTLSERIAVHLDVDALILKPLDSLFDAMLFGLESSTLTDDPGSMQLHGNSTFPRQVDAFFTRDYNLAKPGKLAGMQGGFLVIRPSTELFKQYCAIVLEGDHRRGSGWGGRGHGGYYGAQQIQGLVAHFYDFVRPNTAIELNRCQYNAMVDHPKGSKGEDCRERKVEDIVSAHFTICQKPWKCINTNRYAKLCAQLHREWFSTRRELEMVRSRDHRNAKGEHNKDIALGYCKSQGARGYIPLKLLAPSAVELPLK